MAKQVKSKDWEGPSLRAVLWSMTAVAVFMGVFAYYRYITSEKEIMAGMASMEAQGTKLDSEGQMVWRRTLGVGAGTLAAGVIVGAFGTSAVTWIVLGASAVTVVLSLVALPSRAIRVPAQL